MRTSRRYQIDVNKKAAHPRVLREYAAYVLYFSSPCSSNLYPIAGTCGRCVIASCTIAAGYS